MSHLTIRVLDAVSSEPIAGARAGLFIVPIGLEGKLDLLDAETGPDGSCLFDLSLSEGRRAGVVAVVGAPGYAEWRDAWDTFQASQGREVLVIGARESRQMQIPLRRGTTIAGRVTDGDGRPIPGARIGLVLSTPISCSWPYAIALSREHRWPLPCVTDERGRYDWLSFRIEDAADRGGRWVLTAEHDDFAPSMVQSLELREPDEEGVLRCDVEMGTGRIVKGRVLDPGGRGVEGARVRTTADPLPDQPGCILFRKEAEAGGRGEFAFRGLLPMGHTIEAEAEGFAPARMSVDLAADTPDPIALTLHAGAVLQGQVFDADGKPVTNLQVFTGFGEAPRAVRSDVTDGEGRFRLVGLPAEGEIELIGSGRFQTTVDLPTPPVRIQLPREVDLSMVLLAADDRSPLGAPGVVIGMGAGGSFAVPVGEDGKVGPAHLPPGEYTFVGYHPEYAVREFRVRIPEEGLGEPLELALPRGSTLTGTVRDRDGSVLKGVQVMAFGRGVYEKKAAETDATGSFRLAGLPHWSVVIAAKDGYALRYALNLDFDGPVEITLGEGGTVRGKVRTPEGVPVPSALVKVVFGGRVLPVETPHTLTDATGGYRIRNVPVGDVGITAGGLQKLVALEDGQEIVVDFEIEA